MVVGCGVFYRLRRGIRGGRGKRYYDGGGGGGGGEGG